MAYAGSKRSKEEFPSEEEVTTVKSLQQQQQQQQQQECVVNPAKVARTSWEADGNVAGESSWKRGLQQAHQPSVSQSLASPREFQISNPLTPPPPNTSSSCSSSANAQLNFQQRVMAAAALQEIRGIHPVSSPASFKFPLDASSSSNTLLEHLTLPPPLSPAMQVSSQRGLRDLDPVYSTSMLQNLPPIPPPVHAQVQQSGVAPKLNGESLSSYSGILQQPMLQQVPLLPPAPGLLGRDPCAWFTSNLNVNNGGCGGGGGKENMLVPPLPPFQDVISSLSGIPALSPGLSSFQSPAEFLDHPPVPSVSGMQQHAHAQQHLVNQQQQQQHQQQPSCSYRSDLIIPPPPTPKGEIMFSNGSGLQQNGFGSLCSTSSQIVGNLQRSCNYVNSNGNKVQQLMNGSTAPPNRVQQYSSLHLTGGGGGGGGCGVAVAVGGGGGVGCGGAGSSYCSSEMAASSVTSVHNAAASSSNTTMQNGSPEDTTTLAQRPQHSHPGTNSNNNKKQPPTRTYTKVYKLGSIGRAVDVTRFSNYTELRWELARMFNLEGQLDQKSGWQLVFIDHEGDILLVGDDPWEEFVTSVRGIRILSPSEVAFYTSNETGTPAPHSSLTSNGML